MLLHRLQQRGLRLRGSAVDFIREQHVAKNRPWDEHEFAAIRAFLQNLHARDVRRHEIRRELDAPELQVKNLCDGFHEQRLREPRRAGDETVPPGKKRDEDLLDYLVLANDGLAEFGDDARARGGELLEGRGVGLVVGLHRKNSVEFSLLSSQCPVKPVSPDGIPLSTEHRALTT